MESSWKTTMGELEGYVKANAGISISRGLIIIPEAVRDGFYALFDRVENDFVRENFPRDIDTAGALSTAWAAISRDVIGRMNLESLDIAPALRWFLNDPVDGLSRYFSDDLFAVLKGEIDTAEFETRSLRRVPQMFGDFFKEGYRRWASVALLSKLDASQVFRVPAVDGIGDPLIGEGHENPGQRVSDLPDVQPATAISFQQHPVVSFVVPKVLAHSARLGRFVSMHSDFVEPFWTAREVSERVEWLNFTALKRNNGAFSVRPDQKMLPDLSKILPDIVFYTSAELEDLRLVADHARIARPDVSVEVMEGADWFERGKLATVILHHKLMNPRFGTFIVCREAPPQAAVNELSPKLPEAAAPADASQAGPSAPAPQPEALDIHIIHVGYDTAKLDAVIEALKAAHTTTQPSSA